MQCHACGHGIELGSGERIGYRDECETCGADLHACRGCGHYDPGAYNECRESGAERVLDKELANRCDWFTPGAGAAAGAAGGRAQAKADLDRLFRK